MRRRESQVVGEESVVAGAGRATAGTDKAERGSGGPLPGGSLAPAFNEKRSGRESGMRRRGEESRIASLPEAIQQAAPAPEGAMRLLHAGRAWPGPMWEQVAWEAGSGFPVPWGATQGSSRSASAMAERSALLRWQRQKACPHWTRVHRLGSQLRRCSSPHAERTREREAEAVETSLEEHVRPHFLGRNGDPQPAPLLNGDAPLVEDVGHQGHTRMSFPENRDALSATDGQGAHEGASSIARAGPEEFWAEVAALVRALRLWGLTGIPVGASYAWLALTGGGRAGWERAHASGARAIARALARLGGFYAKVGQALASRPDLVPFAYARELSPLQDSMEPIPGPDVRQIVEHEVLNGESMERHFSEFSFRPIGSASVAQVHWARLYNGREVAVKVQRPLMERVMMGDAKNLMTVSKQLRGFLNVDYYKVFSEMASQLSLEFDFVSEAQAMDWTDSVLTSEFPDRSPLRVPRSVPGLVSKRVLCMTYVQGTPISRLGKNLSLRGMSWRNVAARVAGKRLLSGLTDAYGVMLLREGRFHGDVRSANLSVEHHVF